MTRKQKKNMAVETESVAEASEDARNTLRLRGCSDKPMDQLRAELAAEGLASSASIANGWQGQIGFGNGGITECVQELRKYSKEVRDGDLAFAETMLVGQASALNALFANMIVSAGRNKGEYPDAFERYMRLALKAQSQCRTTLETLAEIRFPRQVAFVKQANIAGGHQQINNGVVPGQTTYPQNEVLEATNVQRVDEGAQAKAGRGNPPLEAMATLDRPKVGRGKSKRQSQRVERRS